ncbi:hypothetical protein GCM10011505_46800 [Tistrella bauzanensis]|jgi:hypothetical protein|uniref:Uncharacterized protein n=1 Tax=Tistrella bauzanensis TaxID=657419 RepID=A0ABQ1J8S8_9PROT|nr:hypothetical protein GCM10011505_46800 [Tistrella bauzanensis]
MRRWRVPNRWWRLSAAETVRWSGIGLLVAAAQAMLLSKGEINLPIGIFLIVGPVLVIASLFFKQRS